MSTVPPGDPLEPSEDDPVDAPELAPRGPATRLGPEDAAARQQAERAAREAEREAALADADPADLGEDEADGLELDELVELAGEAEPEPASAPPEPEPEATPDPGPTPIVRPSEPLTRRAARTRALELLFAADVRGTSATVLLGQQPWVDAFTETLVDAVVEHRLAIDQVVGQHAEGWALDRMPVVDRNVLRLGVAELLHVDEVPAKVAIDEAVELAKSLSTDASPKFVNGVLAAIARANELI